MRKPKPTITTPPTVPERRGSARVAGPVGQPPAEVRFGAGVTLRTVGGGTVGFRRKFTTVGVDEADIALGKVAFVVPIARAVQGAQPAQPVRLHPGPPEETAEIVAIQYSEA